MNDMFKENTSKSSEIDAENCSRDFLENVGRFLEISP